jgi:8-oxo-dGTP pyrophosphatase MutT (NUDIX family)
MQVEIEKAGLLVIRDGRVLLCRKRRGTPLLILPGGKREAGESDIECLVRELREELGLTLSAPPQRLFKLPPSRQTDQEHVWVYRGSAEGPFTLHPDEIERGGWFATGEITDWMKRRPRDFASALLFLWERVFPRPG